MFRFETPYKNGGTATLVVDFLNMEVPIPFSYGETLQSWLGKFNQYQMSVFDSDGRHINLEAKLSHTLSPSKEPHKLYLRNFTFKDAEKNLSFVYLGLSGGKSMFDLWKEQNGYV